MKAIDKIKYIFLAIITVAILMPTLSVLAVDDSAIIASTTKLEDPLGGVSISGLVGRVINGVLGVLGGITLLMFIWGGFNWLTSAGNSEKVKKGTETMLWAAIGVALVLSSYIVVNNLISAFTTAP